MGYLSAPELMPIRILSPKQKQAVSISARVAKEFEDGHGRTQLGLALGGLMRTAVRALKDRSQFGEAQIIEDEWKLYEAKYFSPYLPEDLGDHQALSVWLTRVYTILEGLLGHENCVLLHFTDINVINYSIPVVFKPHVDADWCKENQKQNPTDTCQAEYRRHAAGTLWQIKPDLFAKTPLHDGLVPVVTYWIVWAACEVATQGTGYFVVCSPLASLAEYISERYLSPSLSDRIWQRYNP